MRECEVVSFLMEEFAKRTGLVGDGIPRRYLWTDAFAVCNFLSLYEDSKDENYLKLALKLIDQVHHVLGKFREDDERKGWISGLRDKDGELHPTIGGLRIGKEIKERAEDEPFDEDLEWDRDGQYFHYLTKWMHALSRVTQVTKDHKYNFWAMELAKVAFKKFTYFDGRRTLMYWKMSTDLSRPLVSSMGHHDPLDGFITYMEINEIIKRNPRFYGNLDLDNEIDEFYFMTKDLNLVTADPLGLGGLISDAVFLSEMNFEKYENFLLKLIESSIVGLKLFIQNNYFSYPVEYRLAFRELGLSIGLKGVPIMKEILRDKSDLKLYFDILEDFSVIGKEIEEFWLDERNRENESWREHKDINEVMLATALMPEGFLKIKFEGV
ncbi:MAG: hypothetical protein GXO31_02270 [Epsilonproteobacteria bacterium]|nr:hypothetical protein [Campylobacterota bacterium]